jgi:hypothetical protein
LNELKGITRATNASPFYQKSLFVVQMDRIAKTAAVDGLRSHINSIFINNLQECELVLTFLPKP